MTATDTTSTSSTSGSGSHPGPPRGTAYYNNGDVDPQDVIDAIERPKTLPDDIQPKRKGQLPRGKPPSFGDPDPDCDDPVPGSMYFCPTCSTVHQKPHVCYRYDCPSHWAHAVRRRAAGSKDAAGICAQLDALRRYLYVYRGEEDHYYHHLVYNPPRPRRLASKDALEREKQTVREIMDAIGVQGAVIYHAWAGENEDHAVADPDAEVRSNDDRGEWKDRLGEDTQWRGDGPYGSEKWKEGGVRADLQFRPHFHIVGVAPFVDFSCTPEIYEATGAVLTRILSKGDKSIARRKDEDSDDPAMARVVTYCLSHASVLSTDPFGDDNQRRLAAWMKGPDVHRITALEKNKARMQAIVYEQVSDTLGIGPPDLTCDTKIGPEEVHYPGEISRDSRAGERVHPTVDAWGESVTDTESRIGARADSGIAIAGPAGPDPSPAATVDLPAPDDGFDSWAGSSSRPSSGAESWTDGPTGSSSTTERAVDDDQEADDAPTSDQGAPGECGERLRHISQAGEYLLDSEWNDAHTPEEIERVEVAYTAYVHYMEAQGLDATDDPTRLPAERDDPPPD